MSKIAGRTLYGENFQFWLCNFFIQLMDGGSLKRLNGMIFHANYAVPQAVFNTIARVFLSGFTTLDHRVWFRWIVERTRTIRIIRYEIIDEVIGPGRLATLVTSLLFCRDKENRQLLSLCASIPTRLEPAFAFASILSTHELHRVCPERLTRSTFVNCTNSKSEIPVLIDRWVGGIYQ